MSDQLTLRYQAHSEESRAAAESMKGHAWTLRNEVLRMLWLYGPMTDNELIDRMAGNASSIRPRRIELTSMGLVVKQGTVKQANGRSAAVWSVNSPANGEGQFGG